MLNKEEYITSGILELYATGALTPQERQQVEQAAAASDEVRAALEEAQLALEGYAQTYAVQPGQALKSRIMQQIEDQALEKAALEARPLYPAEQEEIGRAHV